MFITQIKQESLLNVAATAWLCKLSEFVMHALSCLTYLLHCRVHAVSGSMTD